MDNKLTLKLNEDTIRRAKMFAADKKMSLSRLVENYLDALTDTKPEDEKGISPFVAGIATGKSIPEHVNDREAREEYMKTLEQKHR